MFRDLKAEGELLYSVANLIAWLETQPSDRTYSIAALSDCLLTCWAEANGSNDPVGSAVSLWSRYKEIVMGGRRLGPLTYGAALERARHGQA